ncbi:protein translocase subunit SecD [Streptomyces armeniacus]|uniref:Multifunctional fusion protein n=1 Tax=Streptomyces armeniacus TaxID=83291 RepID=A0A345XYD5_9ACTN|nr:protein translocase subunit SecD [Streptomyces armeniacus]AXK36651.1 protein translocase subunit SecD [Streptomyces armeniacus]
MTRATRVRALLALALLALSVYLALTQPPRLGLDLRGGTRLVLETKDSPTAQADRTATDRTLEVLRQRVDALGVSEPTLARSGDQRIVVELPGVQDPREAAEVLGRTAQLSFHPVRDTGGKAGPDGPDGAGGKDGKGDGRVLRDESGQPVRLGPAALTGGQVESAEARLDQERGGGWFVSVELRGSGESAWAGLTGKAACAQPGDPARRAAIVLDDKVISSPQVDPSVECGTGITGGATQITGGFSQDEAEELALLINGGALPVPVDLIEQRTVDATLGDRAIEASAQAAVIGTVLTSLFIIGVYRLLGGLATLALACYGLLSYAALLAIGATLTLPGLAGFVLAIGMAVDANVLVFERAREEYAAMPARRRTLRSALTAGFRKALSAVADSNITTLLAAALLFVLASGPVRGFGVTLSIGVLASMVSALVITRVIADVAVRRRAVMARPRLSGIADTGAVRRWLTRRAPDLMRHRRRWLAGSAAALVLATGGLVVRGLEFGVEFTGGRSVEYTTERPVSGEAARQAVADAGRPRAVVQTSGDGDGDRRVSVRAGELSDADEAKVRAELAEAGGSAERVRDEMIGPSLGEELRRNALIALGVALAAQLAYLALRFRWTFAASSVAGMAHDVLLLVGVFAWLGKPVDGVFLAALLTVIGYSVNDSVVVFDRVRELWSADRRAPFGGIVNTALLQTLPRTLNTGAGAVFILAALVLLGGESLTDFALALLIGVVLGTYSSMFTAAPLAITLEARSSAPPPRPKRPRGRQGGPGGPGGGPGASDSSGGPPAPRAKGGAEGSAYGGARSGRGRRTAGGRPPGDSGARV